MTTITLQDGYIVSVKLDPLCAGFKIEETKTLGNKQAPGEFRDRIESLVAELQLAGVEYRKRTSKVLFDLGLFNSGPRYF